MQLCPHHTELVLTFTVKCKNDDWGRDVFPAMVLYSEAPLKESSNISMLRCTMTTGWCDMIILTLFWICIKQSGISTVRELKQDAADVSAVCWEWGGYDSACVGWWTKETPDKDARCLTLLKTLWEWHLFYSGQGKCLSCKNTIHPKYKINTTVPRVGLIKLQITSWYSRSHNECTDWKEGSH